MHVVLFFVKKKMYTEYPLKQAAQNISCIISVQLKHVIAFCLFSLFALFFAKRDPLFHRQANGIKKVKFKNKVTCHGRGGTVKKKNPHCYIVIRIFFFKS